MNIHWEDVPCPCPWCRAGDSNSLHRIRRMWTDDTPPTPEAQAIMDEIVKEAIESAGRNSQRLAQRAPADYGECPRCQAGVGLSGITLHRDGCAEKRNGDV